MPARHSLLSTTAGCACHWSSNAVSRRETGGREKRRRGKRGGVALVAGEGPIGWQETLKSEFSSLILSQT
ncbi:hypothetical protein BVRB_6g136900 [Beta vulgaris subsp. vulgaris]|nr:hypothetical protein BVRB_6g136900 [Beta vulgaris subsp. vulgaris]